MSGLALVLLATVLQAQAASGTAAITGTVVAATTARPIAGAIVTLRPPTGPPTGGRVQVTTARGRFAFLDLPASDGYQLTVSKPGFLDGGYGRIDPRGPVAPISVKDGEWVADVRVKLAKPGSVSGVVLDERGEPIVGVYVRVLPQMPIAGRVQWLAGPAARTDDRGAYRIAGLGPGKYVVSIPSIQASIPATATLRRAGASAGTSMADLEEANRVAEADRLVVDAGGGQQLVVGRHAVPPPPAADGQRTAYPIAFYPGASNPADATPIDLRASEDRAGIDFQLQPVRTARVSGVVQGPPEAIGNTLLRLLPVGLEELGQGSEAAVTLTMADGRFTFLDVPSGSYVVDTRRTMVELTLTSMGETGTAVPAPIPFPANSSASGHVMAAPYGVEFATLRDGASGGAWGQTRVDVTGRDVNDVVLTLRRPATLSGRYVWAPGSTPPQMPFVPFSLEPADGRRTLGWPSSSPGSREPPGMFKVEGALAGTYFLRVLFNAARVESIVWEGQDYTDRPFDASSGQDISGVVVTLTPSTSTIAGRVTDGGVSLTAAVAVIAFPVGGERWSNYGFSPPRLKSTLTTSDGRFKIDGLPVGDYYVIGVPAAQERAWLDAGFLTRSTGRAVRIRVDSSNATVSDVSLSLVK